MRRPIFLLTDFGYRDYYVAAMKAIILSINPGAEIVDITHNVAPWNISEGGFILWQIIPHLPKNSIIVGVVDPGVGTDRRNIIIETRNHFLIGPDNGLLYPAAHRDGLERVFEINIETHLYKHEISSTFHGRDIYAPTAAYLSKGVRVEELGRLINLNSIISQAWPNPEVKTDGLIAYVIHIDRFGNIITNVPGALYDKVADKIKSVKYSDKEIIVEKVTVFGEIKRRELGILIGSSEMLEIVGNMKSAAEILGGVKPGDRLILLFR
jgi:hypothetical protein